MEKTEHSETMGRDRPAKTSRRRRAAELSALFLLSIVLAVLMVSRIPGVDGAGTVQLSPPIISPVATPTPTPPADVVIRNVHASPNPFNPAQGGTTLGFDLTASCGNTLAAIFDMNGAGVLKYWALGARAAGTQSVPWDGKNSGGTVLGEGMYALFAVCLDGGGNA
ncbi:MAG: hypothetical protein EPO21_01770, partial [Chloroflexota bacterium]